MRGALFGLNVLALAAAAFPAIMIFEGVAREHPLAPSSRETFFVLLFGGVMTCLAAVAALTKRRKPNPVLAMRLLSLAALLLVAATGWSVALFMAA